jgi:hypothetical protein
MNGNCLPKHRRARHGERGEGLLPSHDEQVRMIELYVKGWTQRAIADVSAVAAMLGLSTSAVYRRLLAGGAERRNAGRAAAATRLGTTLDEYQAQRKSRRASAARRKRSTAREAS